MPLGEDIELAWINLFGKNPIPTNTPTETTDRLVALGCAIRMAPAAVIASGASDMGKLTDRARRFEEWLAGADDEQDAQVRRLLLVMVCERADATAPIDRIRALLKELHKHVTRRH